MSTDATIDDAEEKLEATRSWMFDGLIKLQMALQPRLDELMASVDTPNGARKHISKITDTAAPTRRIRRGCSGRPFRRPASSGPGVRSRGWARRSGPCAGPYRRARCGR